VAPRFNFLWSGWQNFPTELFNECAGIGQIGKTPSKIILAFSNNSPTMPRLNLPHPVKVHDLAAQFDTQFIISNDNLDDVGVFSLVRDRPSVVPWSISCLPDTKPNVRTPRRLRDISLGA
jgi:hypothetical protein